MSIWPQMVKFILIGGLNTLVGYSLYALFIFINIDYPLAMLFAMGLGVLFNFKTTGKLVFNNSNNDAIFKFIAVYVFIYFFNMIGMQLVRCDVSNVYVAGFIVIIPSAIITFVLNKLIVFRKKL